MTRLATLLALSACAADSPVQTDPDPPPGATSASEPPTLSARCAPDPSGNALRFACTVEADPPGAVSVRFEPVDGSRPARVHTGEEEVWMYFMAPDTAYRWEASSVDHPEVFVEGQVTTGSPGTQAHVIATRSGSSTAPRFLTSSPCSGGTVLVIDPDGTVLWYQDLSQQGVTPAMIEVVHFTEDETVLAISSEFVVEVDWTGRTLQVLTPGFDGGTVIHHDVFRRQGHTYTLFQETLNLGGDTTYLDGFYVHDAQGDLVTTWRLIDHFTPPIPPEGHGGVVDYSHANAIFVQEDGDVLLSFRHLSTVIEVRGDPFAPDFGEILWVLSGDPSTDALGSDFTLASIGDWPGFVHQHHAHRLPNGRISLFDNRKDVSQRSRVLEISLDEETGMAQMERVWDLGRFCAFQGASWPTATGNPLATCSPEGTAIELQADDPTEVVFEITLQCGSGSSHYIPRFVPLSP